MSSSPLLLVHICGGGIGLLSGAVAMTFRKGTRGHRVAGNVFFVSMLCMAGAGAYMALTRSETGNVLGGVLAFYLVATGWMTVIRREGETGIFDWVAFLAALAVGAVIVTFGIEAAMSPTGTKAGHTGGHAFLLWFAGFAGSRRGPSHATARRDFRSTTDRAPSLADVLRAVRRFRIFIPLAAALVPRFHAQDGHALSAGGPATGIDGFLAGPSALQKCVQETCLILSRRGRSWGNTRASVDGTHTADFALGLEFFGKDEEC